MNILSSILSFIAEKIGNTAMGTEAETLTGAIAEHQSTLSDLGDDVTDITNRMGGSWLPEGLNINNLTKAHSGCWVYNRSENDGTYPIEDTYGTICHVQGTSDNIAMQFIRSNAQNAMNRPLYVRYKMNGAWGAWQYFVSADTANLTITRTANSYCSANDLSELAAVKKAGWLHLRGNIRISTAFPRNTSGVQIATISGWSSPRGEYVNVPCESAGGSVIRVTVSWDGKMYIVNSGSSAVSGGFFFSLTAPIGDGGE